MNKFYPPNGKLRSSWLSLARVIPHSVGDFPLRGKMSVKLTKGSGKNVGVADKREGHPLNKGKLFSAKHCKFGQDKRMRNE